MQPLERSLRVSVQCIHSVDDLRFIVVREKLMTILAEVQVFNYTKHGSFTVQITDIDLGILFRI